MRISIKKIEIELHIDASLLAKIDMLNYIRAFN